MERLLTYGLSGGVLRHISEVENGVSCGCVCSKCSHPLVAKNSSTNKKAAHFAHYSGKECDGAYETALHLLAKAVLLKTKQLMLPDYHYDYQPANEGSLYIKGKAVHFDKILLEQQVKVGNEHFVPDAIGLIGGKQVYIEFANTHFVDQEKLNKIKKLGVPCVEVNLAEQTLEEEALRSFFNSNSHMTYWINNPRLDKDYLEYKKYVLAQEEALRQRRLADKEAQKEEAIAKLNYYRYQTKHKVLWVSRGKVPNCPKRDIILSGFKNDGMYRHNILRKIIDGGYWNGEFYGQMPNGKWIFINKDKTFVFPPDSKAAGLSDHIRKLHKFLYASLKTIKDNFDEAAVGVCDGCDYSVDNITIEDKGYQICKCRGV